MVIKIPHWHASVTGKEKSIQLDQNWSHLWAGIHNHHLSFTWSHCITDFIHIRCGHDCISVKWARAHSWELVQALCYLQEETIPNLTKSVEIKLSIDDFWRSYTFFFFLPPLVAKLIWFLPFPALAIHLGSQSVVCGLLGWADAIIGENPIKKMIRVTTSFLLKMIQHLVALNV